MKNTYYFFTAGLLAFITLFSGCNLINPAEPVPSYIHIERIGLTITSSEQGSASSKISDAWVYIDDQLQGIYELPTTFPVLSQGTHKVFIKAGIKINGISATRGPYPFYDGFTQTVTLSPGNIVTLSPTVQYASGLNWASSNIWQEDFENVGITLSKPPSGADTTMIKLTGAPNPNIFEGTGSGVAYMDNTYTLSECMSSSQWILPRGDSPVFLEFDYKCNHNFTVGLYCYSAATSTKDAVISLHRSDTWNKAYVYLSPTIKASTNALSFSVFFGMLNNIGSDSLGFALDNIKLIHY